MAPTKKLKQLIPVTNPDPVVMSSGTVQGFFEYLSISPDCRIRIRH